MTDWLDRAIPLLQAGKACVLVTVVATEGSTPRETGSKMLVHEHGIEGSVGGGHLEFKTIERARVMLAAAPSSIELADFALGPSLGQCCGGRVQLLLERLDSRSLPWLGCWRDATADRVLVTNLADGSKIVIAPDSAKCPGELGSDVARLLEGEEPTRLVDRPDGQPCYVLEQMKSATQDLYLFGSGHVGRALVHVLAALPYRIHWFDTRAEMFPADLPANVVVEVSADPRHDVAGAPADALFLVMTHSHALDFDICDRVLRRDGFGFLGLIGSATKRASFARRLQLRGHSQAVIARLTCPIGLPAIAGKAPAAVAISVAGQLLTLSQAKASGRQAVASERTEKGMNNAEDFMRRAIAISAEKMRDGLGGPFGAVVVKSGHIIAEGFNRVTSTNDPTAHAEVVALRAACAALGSFRLEGCELYTSCEPCPMCLGAIYWARLDRVYYANDRADAAAIGFDDDRLYREFAKPMNGREMPFIHLPLEEARAVFQEWVDKPDKVPY